MTHVRLHIYPDGGVARLRVWGRVLPDWSKVGDDEAVDLLAVANGGAGSSPTTSTTARSPTSPRPAAA